MLKGAVEAEPLSASEFVDGCASAGAGAFAPESSVAAAAAESAPSDFGGVYFGDSDAKRRDALLIL